MNILKFILRFGALSMSAVDAEANSGTPVDNVAEIPNVVSHDQRNGVTAGYVGQLTQILPTLVRGPQLEKLKEIFVEGARIKRFSDHIATDSDIDVFCVMANSW